MAAGVTTSANSSSVPTTWTAIVMVSARRTTNAKPSARTGTPRASATSGSTDANTRGRARTASVSTTKAVNAPNTSNWSREIASRLPNSTEVVVPALALASEAKSTPSAVASARIVPVAISRSATRRPNSPISSPPATQNTARPRVTGSADEDRAGRPGEADVGERVRGEGVLPGDDEVAEQARGDGDQRAAEKGVLHEGALQHVEPVRLELHRQDGAAHASVSRHAARVNRSPWAVRTTPTGVP